LHAVTRVSAIFLATLLVGVLGQSAFATTATWDNGAPGGNKNKWASNGQRPNNWNPNQTPNAADDVAIFAGDGNSGISLEENLSVGEIRFDSTNVGYVISGSNTLTFDVTSGSAALNVLSTNSASHELGMNMTLADDLVIDHQGTGVLTLSGAISGVGRNVTLQGSGSVVLMSASNSFDGTTTVTGGTLNLGADNVLADGSDMVINGGTFNVATHSDTINALTLQAGNLSGTGSLTVSSLSLAGGSSDIDVSISFSSPATDLTLDNASTDVVTIRKPMNHSGATRIRQGRMELRGNGAIRNSPNIDIAAGAFLDVSNAAGGGITLESGQVLGGSGTVLGSLTVASGSQLSPGNSPGTLTTGDEIWEGGGSLLLEMDDAAGVAGIGWDLLDIVGTLSITADLLSPFEIDLTSLLEGTDTPGDASNFPGLGSWTIVQTTGGITGFSTDSFTIDTSAFTNTHFPTSFGLQQVGNNLVLSYVVPEPGTGVLVALGMVMLGLRPKSARYEH
jgi:autotransporter-associated beta strand protein